MRSPKLTTGLLPPPVLGLSAPSAVPEGAGTGISIAPRPHVVIVGGGFGGLAAAQRLADTNARVTLVDRYNHHLFQPLLYQVATAGLSPADIASPIRRLLGRRENARVMMAEVTGVNPAEKKVLLGERELPYDHLVIAAGATPNYFAHPEWEAHAPTLKTLDDALAVRRKLLTAFERAEIEPEESLRRELLNFVVIGGGATGVELAGAIAELSRRTLVGDFRAIRPEDARITVITAGARILSDMPEELSEKAAARLQYLGASILTNTNVSGIGAGGVATSSGNFLPSRSVFWTAGVKPAPVARWLGVVPDPQGRVPVDGHCRVAGLENVYVIGDAASFMQDGAPVPGLAAVAKQQGRYVGNLIAHGLEGKTAAAFRYRDKGYMNVVGRSYAVARIGGIKSAGFAAWLAWWIVHIRYLADFRNKAGVFLQWIWSYLTFAKGARLITGEEERTP